MKGIKSVQVLDLAAISCFEFPMYCPANKVFNNFFIRFIICLSIDASASQPAIIVLLFFSQVKEFELCCGAVFF